VPSIVVLVIARIHLVVAGGYDERVDENREYHLELSDLVSKLELTEHVTFLRSVSSAQKRALLARASCLLYTPDREHFGIVPVEAMTAQCPVIAVNSGGPCETVLDGVTGFLRPGSPCDFADAMKSFVGGDGAELRRQFGKAGKQRVHEHFSFESFAKQLNSIVCELCCTEQ
jgi:alpha-1,3/alpha-1,6-mannosyltransferase